MIHISKFYFFKPASLGLSWSIVGEKYRIKPTTSHAVISSSYEGKVIFLIVRE
jgi:hypothetical protein